MQIPIVTLKKLYWGQIFLQENDNLFFQLEVQEKTTKTILTTSINGNSDS